jgi:hypothetical protein
MESKWDPASAHYHRVTFWEGRRRIMNPRRKGLPGLGQVLTGAKSVLGRRCVEAEGRRRIDFLFETGSGAPEPV